jgi:hypothetical protein
MQSEGLPDTPLTRALVGLPGRGVPVEQVNDYSSVMKRTSDVDQIEHRLLELAFTTDVKITAPALAYFAPCSIDDASRVLEDLAARDRVQMEVEDSGTIVYHVPARQQLKPTLAPAIERRIVVGRPQHEVSPALAALLSVAIPGLGHLYARRVVAAIAWFFVVSAGYALILPGLLIHFFSILSAAASAHRLNASTTRLQLAA